MCLCLCVWSWWFSKSFLKTLLVKHFFNNLFKSWMADGLLKNLILILKLLFLILQNLFFLILSFVSLFRNMLKLICFSGGFTHVGITSLTLWSSLCLAPVNLLHIMNPVGLAQFVVVIVLNDPRLFPGMDTQLRTCCLLYTSPSPRD